MEMLLKFWGQVEAVWRKSVFDIGIPDVVLGLAVLLVFVVLRGVFTQLVLKSVSGVVRRTRTSLDDQVLAAIEKPLRLLFVVIGLFVASEIVTLTDDVAFFMERLIRSLIAFTIFWTLYRCIEPFSFLVKKLLDSLGHNGLGASLQDFFIKLAKFVIVCVGVVAVLEEWEFNVGAVLGGLGLMGMAVAFGAQNLISNLFSGISIFIDRLFEKGDWIRTEDVEGVVEEIGFRTTKIRRFDKALTTLPNNKLANEAVINFSRMTNRRIFWKIGVEYRTTEEQLREIVNGIREYIHECGEFETDPERVPTMVHVDSFNDSSIDIMLYCFTHTTAWTEWMAAKERLAYRVKQIVLGAGTAFAFPSTSIYLETVPFGTPEPFPARPLPVDQKA